MPLYRTKAASARKQNKKWVVQHYQQCTSTAAQSNAGADMHQALQEDVQLVCFKHASQVKVMVLLTWTCSCLMQASILQEHDQGLCHLCNGCRDKYDTQRTEPKQ